MPQLGKAAGGRRTADETDGYVPTSRLSNSTSATKDAQIGAKTDPKPFTTENVLLCISITMLASILAHILHFAHDQHIQHTSSSYRELS